MIDPLARFAAGFGAFFRGFGLLGRTPGLWPFAVAPLAIGMTFLVSGLVWAFGHAGAWIGSWAAGLEFAPEALRTPLYWAAVIFSWPVLLLAVLYVSYLFTKLVGSPFYALLAERSLIALALLEDKPFRFVPWLRVSARMFVVSLLKTLLFAMFGALLFVATWIPGVNLAAAFGFLLIVSFDCADYSFEAMQMGFRDRLRYFREHFAYFCGFAGSLGLVFFVPGFNFFLLPAAVAGGSELVRRIAADEARRAPIPTEL